MGKKYIRANMATKFIAPYRLFMEKQSFFDPFYTKIGTQSEKKKFITLIKKLWVATLIYLCRELFVFSRLKVKKNTYKNM